MEWLFWLFGALVVITLVGHGIWVLIAHCFKPRKQAVQPIDDLEQTEARVTHLLAAGLIDPATHQQVVAGLRVMRQHRTPPPIPVLPMPPAIQRDASPEPAVDIDASSVLPTPDMPTAHAPEAIASAQPRALRRPRRSPSEVFAAFLRESNIRWGELVGGLLIIGCSIALVISFWNQIADKPFFQFGVFTTITAAMMGLGLYAEHRWKLPTTSRGILLIATLLVPLNFLAFAALSHGRPALPLITLSEIAALSLFGFLVWRAARVLAPFWPNLLTTGVLGLSASLLIAKHLGPAQSLSMLFILASVPIAIYGGTTAIVLNRARRWQRMHGHAVDAIFLMLGVLTFAATLAVGLVVFQTENWRQAAHRLAPLLSLASIPALATGLLLWRRVTDRRLARFRTAGTAIAVAAAFAMLGAIALAWPDPATMLPLAVVDFIALTTVAAVFEMPAAHLLAAPCLLLAYLLGFHLARGHVGWTNTPSRMAQVLIAPGGGTALVPLFLLTAAVALLLRRRGRYATSTTYSWISVGIAAISLGLVTWRGFALQGDPHFATCVYFIYGVAALATAWRSPRQAAGWAGCALLLAAFVQFFITRTHISYSCSPALLAYATAAIGAAIVLRRDVIRSDSLAVPFKWTATIVSAAAIVLLLAQLSPANAGAVSWRVLWVSGLWFALAALEESSEIFTAGQIALALAATLGVVARLSDRAWFKHSPHPLLEPWTLQAVGLVLALLAVTFLIARLVLPERLSVSRWLRSPWSFDHVLVVGLAVGLAGLMVVAIEQLQTAPGAKAWTEHAAGMGTWVLLAMVEATFLANAWQERSAGWALGAAWVCNLATTLGYALAVINSGDRLDLVHGVRLVQLNVVTIATCALVWRAVLVIRRRTLQPAGNAQSLLRIEISLALAGNALLLVPAALWLIAFPDWREPSLVAIGDPLGWAALLMAIGAAIRTTGRSDNRLSAGTIALTLVSVSLMAALTAESSGQSNWLSFHVLMTAGVASAVTIPGVGVWIGRSRRGMAELGTGPVDVVLPVQDSPIALQYQRHDQLAGAPVEPVIYAGGEELQPAFLRWTGILSGFVVLLAVRAMAGDPQTPWWSIIATAVISLLWTGVACWAAAPRLLYVGGLLLNLAATMWCVEKLWASSRSPLIDLVSINIGVMALFGLASLVLHLHVFSFAKGKRPGGLVFHRFAAAASTFAIVLTAVGMLWGDVIGLPLHAAAWMSWAALASAGLLAAATLWDAQATSALPQLYLLGLAAIALAMAQVGLRGERLQTGGVIALAGYVLLTGTLYGVRNLLRQVTGRLGLPLADGRLPFVAWVAPVNLILASAAAALAIGSDFSLFRPALRLGAATAVVVQIAGLVLAARGDRRLSIRQATLGVAALAALAWAWAWMPPSHLNPIDRAVVTMAALMVTAAACALAATRWLPQESLWAAAARSVLAPIVAVWGINLLAILGIEIFNRATSSMLRVHPAAIAAVAVSLMGAAAAAIVLALSPRRDPLRLSDKRRGIYVYTCEGLLALTFVHLRLTMPWLFGGILSQYWPLLIMGLAFAGVALGELFRRRGTLALSSPLFRTGIFLPLLPVLAFWLAPSRVEFSSLLFTIGAFYAILSATRRSFGLGVLAALAANGGLWSLLYHQPQFGFFLHPQLWLIPVAISVLIAAQLNHDRLPAPRLRFVRYCCLMLVYVSSTADIFLNGVRDHPWLPLVLAGLSVAGVMIGILYRLRAFLFLGIAFLGVAILTMIYYASANFGWTWLWYVAGIALGATIIAVFALFEKKRADMLAMMQGLRQWQ